MTSMWSCEFGHGSWCICWKICFDRVWHVCNTKNISCSHIICYKMCVNNIFCLSVLQRFPSFRKKNERSAYYVNLIENHEHFMLLNDDDNIKRTRAYIEAICITKCVKS